MRKTFANLIAAALATALAWAQAQQPSVVSAGAGNPYQRAGQLPARIMDFKAEPASIQPGQKVTLRWSVENPTGITVDPDLGRVTPTGVRQLSPERTTTYTLTVRGPNNQVLTRQATVSVAGTTPAESKGASAANRETPRTAAGHPDLSGVYDFGGGGRGGRGGNAASAAAAPE